MLPLAFTSLPRSNKRTKKKRKKKPICTAKGEKKLLIYSSLYFIFYILFIYIILFIWKENAHEFCQNDVYPFVTENERRLKDLIKNGIPKNGPRPGREPEIYNDMDERQIQRGTKKDIHIYTQVKM